MMFGSRARNLCLVMRPTETAYSVDQNGRQIVREIPGFRIEFYNGRFKTDGKENEKELNEFLLAYAARNPTEVWKFLEPHERPVTLTQEELKAKEEEKQQKIEQARQETRAENEKVIQALIKSVEDLKQDNKKLQGEIARLEGLTAKK